MTNSILVCGSVRAILEFTVAPLVALWFGTSFAAVTRAAGIPLPARLVTSVMSIISDRTRGVGKQGARTGAGPVPLALLVPCFIGGGDVGPRAVAGGVDAESLRASACCRRSLRAGAEQDARAALLRVARRQR